MSLPTRIVIIDLQATFREEKYNVFKQGRHFWIALSKRKISYEIWN